MTKIKNYDCIEKKTFRKLKTTLKIIKKIKYINRKKWGVPQTFAQDYSQIINKSDIMALSKKKMLLQNKASWQVLNKRKH